MYANELANKKISMTSYDTKQLDNIATNAYPNTVVDNRYSDASYNTTVISSAKINMKKIRQLSMR